MQQLIPQPLVVDPQLQNDCLVSARIVAHNPGLTMRVGEAGGGSYHNSETNEFVLDPLHCATRYQALWTACHEGMHSWQTAAFSALPLTQSAKQELYEKVGFSSTSNVIEDCAGNDGMVRGFPGLGKDTVEVYREQLASKGGILGHPDIVRVAEQIGREPKFGLALKIILNAWAQYRVRDGDFKKSLSSEKGFAFAGSGDSDVDEVLKEAALAIRTAINTTLIDGNEAKPLVKHIGLSRFVLTKDFVFPFIEKLVALDIKQEQRNQAAKKAALEGALSEETQKEIADQRSQANKGNSAEEQEDSEQGENPSQSAGSEAQTPEGKQGEGTPSNQGSDASEEKDQVSGSVGDSPGASPADGKDASPEDTQSTKSPGSTANAQTSAAQDSAQQAPELENQKPIDVSKLSDKAQQEIADYLNSLSPEERAKLDAKAKRLLQDYDDAIADALKPKTTANDTAPTHREQEQIKEQIKEQKELDKAFGSRSKALRREVLEKSSPYQKLYLDIALRIDEVEEIVRTIFKLEDDEEWQKGYASGQKTTGNSAMSFEADASNYDKIWHRRSLATSYSYEFDLLVDRSGSMGLDQKMEQTKRVAVFLVELLARFKVPCSVRVFDDSVQTVKKWEDDASDLSVQKRIAESFAPQGGTDDAKAIAKVYQDSDDRQEKHKYILVLSDAESGASSELRAILKQVQDEGKVILFHFGIGANTKDSHGFYAHSKGDLPITGEGSFFDVFTEVLGEIIAEPHLFKGPKV